MLKIANNERRPVCRDIRYYGLASLCFKLGEDSKRRKKSGMLRSRDLTGTRHLTAAEVSVITGLSKETIAVLVKLGALQHVRGDAGQQLIDRQSFETFHRDYANGQIYRGALDCPLHMVSTSLRRWGVELGYNGCRVTTKNSVVRREEVREKLKLDLDPDDPSLHSFPAWDHFKDEVRRYCPSYFVQPVFIDGGARIATANYNVSLLAVRAGPTSFDLVFDMVAAHAKRRWRMFESCSDAVTSSLSTVTWEVSSTRITGTQPVHSQSDVKDALNMLAVLNQHIKQR